MNLIKTGVNVTLIPSKLVLTFSLFQIDFNELIFITSGALLLTLCIEMPIKNLRNANFKDKTLIKSDKMLAKKIE